MTLPEILTRFDTVKHRPNGGAQARCPAHDDKAASLSIDPGEKSGILVHCFAGCDTAAIVSAAGLTMADLMPPKEAQIAPVKPSIVAIYPYTDEDGILLYEALRYEPKKFNQRRPNPKKTGAYLWNLQGVRSVLYRLPEVAEAAQDGKRIYLVEGEKDADRLLKTGLIATTNSGGAEKWEDSFADTLTGAHVIILPDNDDAGRKHAQKAAASLNGKAASVRVLELPNLPPKGDVSDWLNAGGTCADLEALADAAPIWADSHDTLTSANGFAIPLPELRDGKGLPEYAPHQIAGLLQLPTEAQNSNRALAYRAGKMFADELVYCNAFGWASYSGKNWQRDDKDGSATAARFTSLSRTSREEAATLFSMVSQLVRDERIQEAEALQRAARSHLRHVKEVESERFAKSAMMLSREQMRVPVSQFELRPWVIGFANGVWDKGQWRKHHREDFFLELCPVEIDSNADRSEWMTVLERITGGDEDFARTLQDVAGYALSGASHLRTLPWLYGPAGTGKGTYSELLTTMLGKQAGSVDPKKLQEDADRERLGADLWNRRVIICAEAGMRRIEAEVLKTLSGGDSYPVRFLYGEQFTAKPTHVLFMVANDPPVTNAYDEALRDRVLALPFEHRLSGSIPIELSDGKRLEEVRQNISSRLVRGFAAWAIDGLDKVYRRGEIHRSERVRKATLKFWQDADPLTEFWQELAEEAEIKLPDGISKADLRRRYEGWCLQQGIRKPYGPKVWAAACRSYGLYDTLSSDGKTRLWRLYESAPPSQAKKSTDTTDTTEGSFLKVSPEKKYSQVGFSEKGVLASVVSENAKDAADTDAPFTEPDANPFDDEDPFAEDEEEYRL